MSEDLANILKNSSKEEIVKNILDICKNNQSFNESLKLKFCINKKTILNNERINFNIQKHMAFKFMYIGKNYDGLVTQKDVKNTIEEHIFSSLKKASLIQTEEKCEYTRCGRTDAGVSSVGNVFDLKLRFKEGMDYVKILNNILPKDIIIIGEKEVDNDFDSRFSCLFREYKYFFFKNEMEINKMLYACKKLEGLHNFKNFCKIDKSQPEKKNYMRRIYSFDVKFYKKYDNLDIYVATIRGSAFLWHQVRCMMAILFLIGKGLEDIEIIDKMFDVESGFSFNYEIASDLPLILNDCQYEGIDFKNKFDNTSESYLNLLEMYKKSILESTIYSYFLENMNDRLIRPNNLEDVIKYQKNRKYTKLLNHKINRNKI